MNFHRFKSLFLLFALTTLQICLPNSEAKSAKLFKISFTKCPPQIDGELNDPCWKEAPFVTDFTQQEPSAGKPATQKTIVYSLYDEKNLYFAINCFDSEPDQIVATLTRRDSDLSLDDVFWIFIDTYHDYRSCYYFGVNPLGTQTDGRVAEEGLAGGKEWDGKWTSACSITKDGWIAEIAIPFSILKFKRGNETWGVNFYRVQKRKLEKSFWVDTGTNVFKVSMFGHLSGLGGIERELPFHLIPYFTLKTDQKPTNHPQSTINAGADFNYNVSSNLALSITVNPDYCQIEPDEDQINLSKEFELYLLEKRPFFLEGLELFSTPIRLLYTRRISDIDYGGKVNGKIGSFDFALFNVESPKTEQELGANYFALRVKKGIFKSSNIGVLAVNKEKEGGGYNRAYGLDLRVAFPHNINFMGQVCENRTDLIKTNNKAYYIVLWQNTNTYGFTLRYDNTDKNFSPETGYISRADLKGPMIHLQNTFWTNRVGLEKIIVGTNFYDHRNHDDKKLLYGGGGGTYFYFQNKLLLYFQGSNMGHRYGDNYYTNTTGSLGLAYNSQQWNGVNISYNGGKYYGADMDYFSLGVSRRIKNRLAISLDLNYQLLKYPQQGERNYWINVLKLNYKLTDKISCRLFLQSSDFNSELTFNFLMKYDFFVGSHIYLAWNEIRDNTKIHKERWTSFDDSILKDRTLFLKLCYDFGF